MLVLMVTHYLGSMGNLERNIGMPLYEVPPNSKIRVLGEIRTPPAAPEIKVDDILIFKKLDGMYSRCINEEGEDCYLAGWAQVEIIKDEEE
mgnify:CR=1 FL=1